MGVLSFGEIVRAIEKVEVCPAISKNWEHSECFTKVRVEIPWLFDIAIVFFQKERRISRGESFESGKTDEPNENSAVEKLEVKRPV